MPKARINAYLVDYDKQPAGQIYVPIILNYGVIPEIPRLVKVGNHVAVQISKAPLTYWDHGPVMEAEIIPQ